MVLGALTIPVEQKSKVYSDIRQIKLNHGLSTWFEIKWTKVSEAKLAFYKELLNYFFDNVDLLFRGVIATGKDSLDHEKYNDSNYDKWYYKMYYQLLDPITPPLSEYKIYIDVKDTNGGSKVQKLQEVLCNNKWDFNREIIRDIKQIHSNESEVLQICDLLIGALSFFHRGLYFSEDSSAAKKQLIEEIIKKSGSNLLESTLRSENKFNLFIWQPRGRY